MAKVSARDPNKIDQSKALQKIELEILLSSSTF